MRRTALVCLASLALAQDFELVRFERQQLSAEFRAEGAHFGDVDGDGALDVVCGPFWYAGPDFAERRAYTAGRVFDKNGYSDNFFVWLDDLDGDGDRDILRVGFPGQAAHWFENPGGRAEGHWPRHLVLEAVDNESPTYTDLTGDGRPELVCQQGGRLGWAEPAADPRAPWRFQALSTAGQGGAFSHGLGVGDVDGDGRQDVLSRRGWWKQPATADGTWEHTPVVFGARGGAQMFTLDVDGDGDADVITSEHAHGYGLSWYEQRGPADFLRHEILGERPHSADALCCGNLHALTLVDVDGDGLQDIVTGVRHWAHNGRDKADGEDPVLAWFRLERGAGGARFRAHEIDAGSGVGTQVEAGDLDGDGRPEVVVGNKLGCFVLWQRPQTVDRRAWFQAQREERQRLAARNARQFPVRREGVLPVGLDGRRLNTDFETGELDDWEEDGPAFEDQPIRGDTVRKRRPGMASEHQGKFWIGGFEPDLSDAAQGTLTSAPFVVSHPLASFLVAGGGSRATRVELVRKRTGAPDSVLFATAGGNRENLEPCFVDLGAHRGETIFIRLVDESSGGWGHLNFDDFRFHPSDAELARLARSGSRGQLQGYLPQEAAARMEVPEGFAVDLIAGEPDLQQPIALTVDARGRLWVAEAFSYPVRRAEGEGLDRIAVFADEDGDGHFETRTEFLTGLNLVSGLEVGFGGVWIGAAPELLFVPDADGDLVPDGPAEVVLDGWGFQDTHETLNSFRWGPDGWLYGCHGVFTHSRVGAPGTPTEERVRLNAGVWRFHPLRRKFEVFAHGSSNPWGLDFDRRGQAFITACVIPHLYHVVQGGRYRRQSGPHFNPHTYRDLDTIADHLHYLGDRPHDGNATSSSVGGGHAHCGALVYNGDAFPEVYRDLVLMNNIHGKRVLSDVLGREGSGYRASHGPEMLRANDFWFLGVALHEGPDGNVYLIDWYDRQACHDRRPEVWDRTNGRLYRLRYGPVQTGRIDLSGLDDLALVGLVAHPNAWHARTARRLLQERGGSAEVRAALRRNLAEGPGRLEALWALHAVDGLDEPLVLELLGAGDEDLRAWSIQLWLETHPASPALVEVLERLAREDPSPVVRLYLACALQRLGAAGREVAAGLLRHDDAADPNLPQLLWYGLEPWLVDDPEWALQAAWDTPQRRLRSFILRRLAHDETGREHVVAALATVAEHRRTPLAEALLRALAGRGEVPAPQAWRDLSPELFAAEGELGDLLLRLSSLFGDDAAERELRAVLADTSQPAARRLQALASLREVGAARGSDLRGLLDDPALRLPVLRALADDASEETAARLLGLLPELVGAERQACLETLVARPAFARSLLLAIVDERQPASLLDDASLRQALVALRDAQVDTLLAQAWGRSAALSADMEVRVGAYRDALSGAALGGADLPHGRLLATRTCLPCHTLFGVGGKIGPDLTGSHREDLDYLLRNIVDPNAEVGRQYLATTVRTASGRVFTGVVVAEDSWSVRLDNGTAQHTVQRSAIEELRTADASLMPVGLLDAFDPDQVRDLVAYLQSPAQVPMRAAPEHLRAWTRFEGWRLEGFRLEEGALVAGPSDTARVAEAPLEFGDLRLRFEVFPSAGAALFLRSTRLDDGSRDGYTLRLGGDWQLEARGRGALGRAEAPPVDGWLACEVRLEGGRLTVQVGDRRLLEVDDPAGPRRGGLGFSLDGPGELRVRGVSVELLN